MKYRLKDRELHRKLDEITDGGFSARLFEERELIEDRLRKGHGLYVIWLKRPTMTVTLRPDMLEEVHECDPKAWNAFPEVTPPVGVLMRAEGEHAYAARYVVDDVGGYWMSDDGFELDDIYRFRPWEDEE